MDEGYGLNQEVAEFADLRDPFVITADCGINAFGPIEAINAAGIDVIVIDHHEPEGTKVSAGIPWSTRNGPIVCTRTSNYPRWAWWLN